MCRHLDLMIEVFGEDHGCRMFRKVAPWYAKRFGPANEFNKRVVLVSSRAEFYEILEYYRRWRQQFLDEAGELKPRFRPAPLVASFMAGPGVANPGTSPCRKGRSKCGKRGRSALAAAARPWRRSGAGLPGMGASDVIPGVAAATYVPQNSLLTTMPRTLSGPWSSRPSVAWSSFCKVSLAFL